MGNNATRWRMSFAHPLRRSFSALAAIGLLLFPVHVFAHPMGNNTELRLARVSRVCPHTSPPRRLYLHKTCA
jgi:hypothetical protein